MWDSELSLLWENFCGIIIFQFVGCPLVGVVFDFIAVAPLLPLFVASSLSLDVGYVFW